MKNKNLVKTKKYDKNLISFNPFFLDVISLFNIGK